MTDEILDFSVRIHWSGDVGYFSELEQMQFNQTVSSLWIDECFGGRSLVLFICFIM